MNLFWGFLLATAFSFITFCFVLRFHCGCVTRQLHRDTHILLILSLSLCTNLTNFYLGPLVALCGRVSFWFSLFSWFVYLFVLPHCPSLCISVRFVCYLVLCFLPSHFSRHFIHTYILCKSAGADSPASPDSMLNSVASHLFAICDCFRDCGLFWRCHLCFHSHSSHSAIGRCFPCDAIEFLRSDICLQATECQRNRTISLRWLYTQIKIRF